MNLSPQNVQVFIRDEMVEAGIVVEKGSTLSYFHAGREYLISVTAVDITNWEQEK